MILAARPAARLFACTMLCACSSTSSPSEFIVAQRGGAVAAPLATLDIPATTPIAIDPRLDGFEPVELSFDTQFASAWDCSIEIERDGESIRTLVGASSAIACEAQWDGTDDSGALVDPGAFSVVATLERGTETRTAQYPLEVMRFGLDEMRLDGADRVGMLYAATDGIRGSFTEVRADSVPWRNIPDSQDPAGSTSLELADGTARVPPAIWEDLATPPLDRLGPGGVESETFNLPTAWVVGATIAIEAQMTTAWRGGVADPVGYEARLVPPDFVEGEPATIANGAVGSFSMSAAEGVGRNDITIPWQIEARRGTGEWQRLSGTYETTHRLYTIVAQPTFDYTDVPHRPWVDVVDRVTRWLEDGATDADAVASAIVEGVFFELGLQYDRRSGASAYAEHGGRWTGANFNLSRFRDLANGSTINCSDAAGIVSVYANMVGIDLRYHIIQHRSARGFLLNYLQPIGFDFAASPFFSGRPSFSYHAVTGPPDTRIFDATLAIDGDGTPSAAPHTALLVQGLSEADYLFGLTPEPANVRVFIDEKMRIR